MTFKAFWEQFTRVEKKLTASEIERVQELIHKLEAQKMPSSRIIARLQSTFPSLSEKYEAERAYWTESKKKESATILDNADDLKLKTFRIVNTPGACKACKAISGNGDKIFNSSQIQKDGKPLVPVHPNCYCLILAID